MLIRSQIMKGPAPKGTDDATKTDEFLEKIQTAFDPSPSFSENHITIFFVNFMLKKPCLKVQNLQHKFLD